MTALVLVAAVCVMLVGAVVGFAVIGLIVGVLRWLAGR
jgi:hypothetical protein